VGDKALQMVRDCFERALEFLEDIDVWEVEYDASGSLPGLSVPIKAYIDVVGEYRGKRKKYHGPMIVDWKTGSKKPDDFQLKTYAALLKEGHWTDVKWTGEFNFSGAYAMLAPKASEARPIDLSEVDPAEVGARYERARRKMEAMMIEPREDRNKWKCGMCFHQENCIPWSGVNNRTVYYDRSKFDSAPY
jgi:CRISPR/Cas system-associated exonuclease Cas4 (RecB family)